ncbi:relaxase/mobilization nuclease domain-containing protein [Acidicapsa acidisoli]|uniref:relaxase/mobilization nuclease domain-containing protein n=1 Tax=Acidicapsa acidisoli TaxID=1615681 RepID=UPI0021DFD787|nr:relaxase/mobilization nuclease domain-containing protein [Acidicapsa acidisoli]
MISKGTTHNNGVRLAVYMTTGKDGETAELWQLRGFAATNIKDGFRDVQIMSQGTQCEQPFFHVQVRNREGEMLTRAQWEHAADRIERMLGLGGQPRAIAFHIDHEKGREHMHVAFSRIDEETLMAKPLPYFKRRLKAISRELEMEFGLEEVTNRRPDKIRFAPTRAEEEQARRLGLNIHEIRNAIRQAWDRSDNSMSFQAALEQEGFVLARGEKRDFIVIDREGGMHALGKRILDVSASDIRTRLGDIAREDLPSVEMARLIQVERQIEKEKGVAKEQTAVHWDRDRGDREWQEAVTDAAIAKEKIEGRYAEPKVRGQQEKEKGAGTEKELDDRRAAVRLAYSLSETPAEFERHLEEAGFRLARTTKEEADLSHRNAAFAREVGRYAPEYRKDEFVAVNGLGHVITLDRRTTGESRKDVTDFLRTLDVSRVKGIQETQEIAGAQLEIERQAFRDLSRGYTKQEPDGRPTGSLGRPMHKWEPFSDRLANSVDMRTSRTMGKAFDAASDAFESLFSPIMTPEQKRDARHANTTREAERDASIDYSQFTEMLARQREEEERAAARERERRGRER